MRASIRVFGLCAALCLLVTSPAEAGFFVVDNLGQPGAGGGFIAGSGIFGPSAGATRFTAGIGEWQIDAITIRVEEATANNPDQMVLRILNDNAGTPGSTVLGTLTSASNITTLGNYVFNPVASINLLGGTSYWLGGFATAVNANYPWLSTASDLDNGLAGWSIGTNTYTSPNTVGGPWNFTANESTMFRIEAAAVPEPGSALLLGTALAGAAVAAIRRRKTRVS